MAHTDLPFTVRTPRRSHFFTVDNVILDEYAAKIGPYGLSVYLALCRFANSQSQCWPSLQKIAKRTRMSRRQVIREIKKLESLGLITVIPQIDEETGEHKTNLYVLLDLSDPRASSDDPQTPPDDSQAPSDDPQTPPDDPQVPPDDSQAALDDSQTLPDNAQTPLVGDPQSVPDDSQAPKQNTKNKNHFFEKKPNNNNGGGGFSVPEEITETFAEITGDEPTEKDRQYLAELATYPTLIIDEALAALRNWLDNPEKETIRNRAAWLVGTARRKQEEEQKRIQRIRKASHIWTRRSYEVPEQYRDIVIGY